MLWFILYIVAIGIAAILFALLFTAKSEDRVARHTHAAMNPWDDVTITRPGDQ